MTLYARYTVLIERDLAESDYPETYDDVNGHAGTGAAAVAQLAGELQHAWNEGGVAGFFQIVKREIIDEDDAAQLLAGLHDPATDFEDNPLPDGWHHETLFSPSDDWFMPCVKCGKRLGVGTEAYVFDGEDGNGLYARCTEHGRIFETPLEYEVNVGNRFTAESPEDAVKQMAAWLDESAYQAGYRVTAGDGTNEFIDAERTFRNYD